MPRKTFVAGQPYLANEVNTYLMTQSVQTYADAAARTTALPSPTEGQIVYLNDTNQYQTYTGALWLPIGGQMPLFDAGRTSTTSITSGSETVATYATATINRGGFVYSAGSVTVPYAGLYSVTGILAWSGNATGYRVARLYLNGTMIHNDYNSPAMANGFSQGINFTGLNLAANDVLEVRALQNSGATLTIGSGSRLIIKYEGA